MEVDVEVDVEVEVVVVVEIGLGGDASVDALSPPPRAQPALATTTIATA